MLIDSLPRLKNHEIMIALNRKQSEYDNDDKAIIANSFTRSPLHAIQFLIIYAGLNDNQRHDVLKKLDVNITKSAIDHLISTINWTSILLPTKSQNTLSFEFKISLADRAYFLHAVEKNCPLLHKALVNSTCVVSIEQSDEVIFTTKMVQNELWEKPFHRPKRQPHWDVSKFILSNTLKHKIASLAEGTQAAIGAFTIKKGRGVCPQVKLHIMAPDDSNEFSIDSKIDVNPGIYNAFVGLTNFYGLERLDGVTVELESQAQFSDKGASASQTQIVTCFQQSACMSRQDTSSIISVEHLHVFFNGLDMVASFDEEIRSLEFDKDIYITLPTQSKINTGISLFATAPMPKDAFLLMQDSKQNASSKSLFSQFQPTHENPLTHKKMFAGISMQVLSVFIATLGIGAVAIGIVALTGATLGLAVGFGTVAFIAGFGLFATGANKNNSHSLPEEQKSLVAPA